MLDAQAVHFIPRSESPADQLGLIEEVVRNKPDAIVFAPFDPKAMVPAVDKLNAAGIPVTNVNERLAGGKVVAYVGTDDYQLALTTARYLFDAMGKKGNVVILEGPENLPTSIARVKAYKDALKEFPNVKLLASKVGELRPPAGGRRHAQLSADSIRRSTACSPPTIPWRSAPSKRSRPPTRKRWSSASMPAGR